MCSQVPGQSQPAAVFVTSASPTQFAPGSIGYRADITTATGESCTDEGTSRARLNSGPLVGPNFIDEDFTSSQLVALCAEQCPPNDDQDNDGLIDQRESHFGTLVPNADSDNDGVKDGDEDSDDDGEDDEDERSEGVV